ncbi:pyruvate formate-lyase [Vibrio ponticus]|nr:pyruvate formate-lyase [Vibrio ponticus]
MTIPTTEMLQAWEGFTSGQWQTEVNTRDFIQTNYTPYEGDESFLAEATPATTTLWNSVLEGIKEESRTHAPLDFDTDLPSTIISHDAGYINQELETIVGLQTDKPLKRSIIANGGLRMVKTSCEVYGRELDPSVEKIFTEYRKTHNKVCFDLYTKDILACRKSGIITGLPDAYGRGRIIGDYRRLALYGINFLIADKQEQVKSTQSFLEQGQDLEKTLRLREELADQIQALKDIRTMGLKYGIDMSAPARTAQEAIQFTYFGYLAAVKSQNGAAMSLGRTSTFLDVYIERDIANGILNESQAQELIDHFIMKLRMVRFLRTPDYDSLFSGDPIWATEAWRAWVWTVVLSLPKPPSVTFIPYTTWDQLLSLT